MNSRTFFNYCLSNQPFELFSTKQIVENFIFALSNKQYSEANKIWQQACVQMWFTGNEVEWERDLFGQPILKVIQLDDQFMCFELALVPQCIEISAIILKHLIKTTPNPFIILDYKKLKELLIQVMCLIKSRNQNTRTFIQEFLQQVINTGILNQCIKEVQKKKLFDQVEIGCLIRLLNDRIEELIKSCPCKIFLNDFKSILIRSEAGNLNEEIKIKWHKNPDLNNWYSGSIVNLYQVGMISLITDFNLALQSKYVLICETMLQGMIKLQPNIIEMLDDYIEFNKHHFTRYEVINFSQRFLENVLDMVRQADGERFINKYLSLLTEKNIPIIEAVITKIEMEQLRSPKETHAFDKQMILLKSRLMILQSAALAAEQRLISDRRDFLDQEYTASEKKKEPNQQYLNSVKVEPHRYSRKRRYEPESVGNYSNKVTVIDLTGEEEKVEPSQQTPDTQQEEIISINIPQLGNLLFFSSSQLDDGLITSNHHNDLASENIDAILATLDDESLCNEEMNGYRA